MSLYPHVYFNSTPLKALATIFNDYTKATAVVTFYNTFHKKTSAVIVEAHKNVYGHQLYRVQIKGLSDMIRYLIVNVVEE